MKSSFALWIREKIRKDPRVILLSGDLGYKTFEPIQAEHPRNYINMGVSEQNMIGVAAGLALQGMRPYCYSIAPFLVLRTLEHIRNDVCFHKLNVKLVGNGGGLAYGLQGSSHHLLEDVALMSALPGMKSVLPFNKADAAAAFEWDYQHREGPAYFRLTHETPGMNVREFQTVRRRFEGHEVTVVALGALAPRVIEALEPWADRLSVFSVHALPDGLESVDLLQHIARSGRVLVVEEHAAAGGLGPQLALRLATLGLAAQFKHLFARGYMDHRLDNYFRLLDHAGLSREEIFKAVAAWLERKIPKDRDLSF